MPPTDSRAKVLGVALYDAPWVSDAAARQEYAVLRTEVEERLEAGRRAAALRRFLVGIGMPKAFVALLPLTPGWRTMTALAPTLRYDLALTAGLPPTEVAARLRVPVHVLVGEKSPPDVHEVAHTLARALPDGAVTTLPGQDHMVVRGPLFCPSSSPGCAPTHRSPRRSDGHGPTCVVDPGTVPGVPVVTYWSMQGRCRAYLA